MGASRAAVAFCGTLLCLAVPVVAQGRANLTLSAYGWSTQPSGEVYTTYRGLRTPPLDLRKDLDMRRHLNAGVRLTWQPGNRALPSVAIGYDHMMADGDVRAATRIQWRGVTYAVSGALVSQADLKDAGLEFFWTPLHSSLADLQVGVEARWFQLNMPLTGIVTVTQPVSGSVKETAAANVVSWLPLVDAEGSLLLPARIRLFVATSYVLHRSDYIYDLRAGLVRQFGSGLRLFAGWRRFRLHIDHASYSVNGDLEFRGVYGGIGFAF